MTVPGDVSDRIFRRLPVWAFPRKATHFRSFLITQRNGTPRIAQPRDLARARAVAVDALRFHGRSYVEWSDADRVGMRTAFAVNRRCDPQIPSRGMRIPTR